MTFVGRTFYVVVENDGKSAVVRWVFDSAVNTLAIHGKTIITGGNSSVYHVRHFAPGIELLIRR